MDPGPFLRGNAFPGVRGVPYPRAKPDPRLPRDTWNQASIPVGVRLEMSGTEARIAYRTGTEDLGYRGDGAGRSFSVWRENRLLDEQRAVPGEGEVTLKLGETPSGHEDRAIVYLPEGMKPEILSVDGDIEPGTPDPRWVVYGDSVVEGWIASGPALAWPAVAGREERLDVVNMGYAGAARGEIPSAEHVASLLPAGVVTIAYGTNCWTRTPHSIDMVRAGLEAFLDIVLRVDAETPVLVVSPILRPDAETTRNELGATLQEIRSAIEEVAEAHERVGLIPGRELVSKAELGDGIHPNDRGHAALARAIGPSARSVSRLRRTPPAPLPGGGA